MSQFRLGETGTLARIRTAVAAAKGIWAMGMSRPKNTPRDRPMATPRRLKCHRRGWPRCGDSQRNQRLS